MVTLKINSVFKKHFDQPEYQIDVSSYYDIEFYLKSIHPRFNNYIRQIKIGEANESFTYVDSNLKIIDKDTFALKKVKDGEVIYLVPIVAGGGGSKGLIFSLALIAISFAVPNPFFLGPSAAGGLGNFGAMTGFEAALAGQATLGGLIGAVTGQGIISRVLTTIALNVITGLFTSTPEGKTQETTVDSGTRTENDMFGSLVNSTTSGTPVSVNYGLFRLGGQFLSGYVLSAQHDRDNAPTIESYFTPASSPLATDVGTNT